MNGSVPAPTLRWKEGDTVTMRVANTLDEDASIHWHGIVLPANMDGVPGPQLPRHSPRRDLRLSLQGAAGRHVLVPQPLRVSGAARAVRPLVIEPREPEPFTYDREHVVMLTDWTDESPERVFAKLKKQSDYYNFNQRTVGDFLRDVRTQGLKSALAERKMWGEMRMNPTDLADVSGSTYTYLMNGTAPAGNWTGLFTPGERVRLRVINGSAMSYFDVRIPGLKMTVVAADGQYVHPSDRRRVPDRHGGNVRRHRRAVRAGGVHDLCAVERSHRVRRGHACRRERACARPSRARSAADADDGRHGHGGMGHDMSAMSPERTPRAPRMPIPTPDTQPRRCSRHPHAGHTMPPQQAADPHAGHDMSAMSGGMQQHPASENGNPLVDMQTTAPTSRLDDPGIGLRDNGRRVLTYADLKSLFDDPDGREPGRTIELH